MTHYLGASVLLPTLVEEGTSEAIDALMERIDAPPVISEFAAGGVASGLSCLVRMRHLDASDVRARLSDFDAWRATDTGPQDVGPADIRLASVFVRRVELGYACRMLSMRRCLAPRPHLGDARRAPRRSCSGTGRQNSNPAIAMKHKPFYIIPIIRQIEM